jgi:hypothetical protein
MIYCATAYVDRKNGTNKFEYTYVVLRRIDNTMANKKDKKTSNCQQTTTHITKKKNEQNQSNH